MTTHKIYVACLAAYNHGILHGEWLTVTSDADALRHQVQKMLNSSPIPDAEEWAVHDHQGFGNDISEWPDLDDLCEQVRLIEESGVDNALVNAIKDYMSFDTPDAIEFIENNYHGQYESLVDYATQFLADTGQITLSDALSGYFNYQAYARDLQLSGDVFTIPASQGVHIFSNC